MLSIRLARYGKKHAPAFRVIVQERHRAPTSKYVEKVGHYIPHQKPKVINLNADRIQYWIDKGAQPTDTVHNLLVQAGVVKGKKVGVSTITKKHATRLKDKEKAAKEKKALKETKVEETKEVEEAPKEEVVAEEKPEVKEEAKPEVEEKPEETKEKEPKAEEEEKKEAEPEKKSE